jgi:hypothetical protein
MRHLIAAFLLLAVPLAAHAEARKYAVLSLVGDQLLVVKRELSVGSRLDKNTRVLVPLPSAVIDQAVVLAVDEALRRADPSARPVLLAARSPALFAAANRALDDGGTTRVFEAVRPVVAGAQATHLILVSKHRHQAMLKLRDGHVGSGWLEGLGFYIDPGETMRGTNTNEGERGFIAPFAYFSVALIDLARGRILAEEYVFASRANQTDETNIGNAWTALSEEEKDRQLTALIREEAARVVPKLVGKS